MRDGDMGVRLTPAQFGALARARFADATAGSGWVFLVGAGAHEIDVTDAGGEPVARVSLAHGYDCYLAGESIEGIVGPMAATVAEQAARATPEGREDERRWAWAGARARVQVGPPSDFAGRGIPDEALPLSAPWGFGLRLWPVLDSPASLLRVSRAALGVWGVTLDEFLAVAKAQTRAVLSVAAPCFRAEILPGVLVTAWEAGTPGYDATRILFPDLLGPPAREGELVLVAAPDRDTCLVLRGAQANPLIGAGVAQFALLVREHLARPGLALGGEILALGEDGRLRYLAGRSLAEERAAREARR